MSGKLKPTWCGDTRGRENDEAEGVVVNRDELLKRVGVGGMHARGGRSNARRVVKAPWPADEKSFATSKGKASLNSGGENRKGGTWKLITQG